MISDYQPFDLLIDDVHVGKAGLRSLNARVLTSPVGSSPASASRVAPKVSAALANAIAAVEERALDANGLIELGSALAALVLPDPVRSLLVRSLDSLAVKQGLRVQLRVDPRLADFPWELVFAARQGGQRDATGFLGLDPRISIVRSEPAMAAPLRVGPPSPRRAVVALASPQGPGIITLDLDAERGNIAAALEAGNGITPDFLEHATLEALTKALAAGAVDIFHFAGHGSADSLILEGAGRQRALLSGEQLAVNLANRGTQLVVLGACETGRREGANEWSGVAARLLGAGIPAVVAMQYKIGDGNAIAFGQAFYQALAAALPIDAAMSAGRLAVFNRMETYKDDVRRAGFWRDWAVPVLYVRPGAQVDLRSTADPLVVGPAQVKATATVDARLGTIAPAGPFIGAEVEDIKAGVLNVRIRADLVRGSVTGARLERIDAGAVHVALELQRVEAPTVGLKIRTLGG
jgi:hypothetical protein